VAAIVRSDRVVIPTSDERVLAGDRLVVFNTRQGIADLSKTFDAAA
jgi:Trk K+ transport system NAD-binding subunit